MGEEVLVLRREIFDNMNVRGGSTCVDLMHMAGNGVLGARMDWNV